MINKESSIIEFAVSAALLTRGQGTDFMETSYCRNIDSDSDSDAD